MIQDVTVIIRSAGERTLEACKKLSGYQVPPENVFVIQERPFSKAVEVCFEIGIREGNKWTLALDADILLNTQAIEHMTKKAGSLGEDLYIYQGTVLDKIYGEYRYGGPHLYQTQHLEKALEFLAKNPDSLRPESDTYKQMSSQGYMFYNDHTCFGIHEYDQYLADYFRKGFLHAKKTPESVLKRFLSNITNPEADMDTQMALAGFTTGKLYPREVQVDIDFFQVLSTQYMNLLHIAEKKEKMAPEVFSAEYPDSIIQIFDQKNPELHFSKIAPFYLDKAGKRIFQFQEVSKNPLKKLAIQTSKFLGLQESLKS